MIKHNAFSLTSVIRLTELCFWSSWYTYTICMFLDVRNMGIMFGQKLQIAHQDIKMGI